MQGLEYHDNVRLAGLYHSRLSAGMFCDQFSARSHEVVGPTAPGTFVLP